MTFKGIKMKVDFFTSFCVPVFFAMMPVLVLIDVFTLHVCKLAKLYGVKVTRSKSVATFMLVLYASVATAFAVLTKADTSQEAALFGGVVGGIVFFIYNVTEYVINDQHKEWVVVLDTVYGILTWVILFLSVHILREEIC
jgi:uncharacterized protein (DUF697 family)